MNTYASQTLRIGLALVVLWFGSQQLLHAEVWTSFLPDWTSSIPLSAVAFIHLNGVFEVISGILLMLGVFTRVVSGLLALHLIGIVFTVGLTATGVRDFGLAVGLVSVFLTGSDSWSLDKKLEYKENVYTA